MKRSRLTEIARHRSHNATVKLDTRRNVAVDTCSRIRATSRLQAYMNTGPRHGRYAPRHRPQGRRAPRNRHARHLRRGRPRQPSHALGYLGIPFPVAAGYPILKVAHRCHGRRCLFSRSGNQERTDRHRPGAGIGASANASKFGNQLRLWPYSLPVPPNLWPGTVAR